MGKKLTVEFLKDFCFKKNIEYLDDYYNINREIHNFRCKKCTFEWKTSFNKIKNDDTNCPRCAKAISKREEKLFSFLKKEFGSQFTLEQRNRKIIKPYELDIVLTSGNNKIAIEYNGGTHYIPIYGQETLKKRQARDAIKTEKMKGFDYSFIIVKDIESTFNREKMENLCENVKYLINEIVIGQEISCPHIIEY